MNTIRIHKHLDLDILHLQELRGMIGHDVEITVRDEAVSGTMPIQLAGEFWNPASLEELAKRQDFRGPLAGDEVFGSLADADWKGCDEWLEEQRRDARLMDNLPQTGGSHD